MRDPLDVQDPAERRRVIGTIVLFVAAIAFMLVLRPSLLNIVLIVIGLTGVVMLHEFGHYIAAKKTGMKVTEFFVGFGPRIWSFRRGETEYGLKALPLGGYVRIIGMNNVEEVAPEDEPRTYRASTTPRKLIVILAGVTVNLILAYLCISIALIGQGVAVGLQPVVGEVVADSPAAVAGIKTGDRIVSIDGTPVTQFSQIAERIAPRGAQPTELVVQRNGIDETLTVTPVVESDSKVRIGVRASDALVLEQYPIAEVPWRAAVIMEQTGVRMVGGIAKLVTPGFLKSYAKTVTDGNASDPNRPRTVVGIATETNRAMDRDPWALVAMLGGLNLFLALFNLIPLLPFDGGHAVIAIYEGIASKVARRKVVVDYNRLMPVAVGVFAVLLVLAIPAFLLDIAQIFG
ncbi:MAG: M50 family metallopeptidase [Acidimicrobiia bacterium]